MGVAAQRRQVVADDHCVDPTEESFSRAEVAEGQLAPSGVPQDRVRHREPERGNRPQRILRAHELLIAERRPGAGVKEVERHLVRSQLRELSGELGPLLDALPIPTSPPQHSSIPASRTMRQVFHRSSYEWVVTTWGKYDFAASRLWL
nr:hypothetical protein [Aeromicrobium sp.]